ncbi:hypothetical protein CUMW_154600 [Citrus unshiu]|nr:hypothetical protein CUMW_154600 [Citrus unshiu]
MALPIFYDRSSVQARSRPSISALGNEYNYLLTKVGVCELVQLIGNALMVHLNHAVDGCVARIAAKLEMMEPCSSVKERIAFSMIKEAEHRGLLSPGKCVLIEITGGNTGIRLAFIAAVFIAIPSVANIDKELCLELWEQKFFLFEQAGVFEEILKVAEEMVKKTPNGFLLQQFNNPANPKIHYNYTGPVIWEDSGGKVDAFNRDWRVNPGMSSCLQANTIVFTDSLSPKLTVSQSPSYSFVWPLLRFSTPGYVTSLTQQSPGGLTSPVTTGSWCHSTSSHLSPLGYPCRSRLRRSMQNGCQGTPSAFPSVPSRSNMLFPVPHWLSPQCHGIVKPSYHALCTNFPPASIAFQLLPLTSCYQQKAFCSAPHRRRQNIDARFWFLLVLRPGSLLDQLPHTTRISPVKLLLQEVPAHTDRSEYAGCFPRRKPSDAQSDMKVRGTLATNLLAFG